MLATFEKRAKPVVMLDFIKPLDNPAAQFVVKGIVAGGLLYSAYVVVKDVVAAAGDTGPLQFPIVGSMVQILANQNQKWFPFLFRHRAAAMKKTNGRNPTFCLKIFAQRFVVISSAANVEYVLKTAFEKFGVAAGPKPIILADLFGTGIFLSDGQRWLMQRKAASKEFSANRFRDFMSLVFVEHSAKLAARFDTLLSSGKTPVVVDLQFWMFALTMDSFCKIAFDKDCGCLAERPSPFSAALDNAQECCFNRMIRGTPRLDAVLRFLGIGEEGRMKGWVRTVKEFCDELIAERLKIVGADGTRSDDLLSRLVCVAKENNAQAVDREFLRSMVINFIIAGRDTTACGLMWFFYEMAFHPGAEAKALEEIHDATQGTIPNFDNLKDCNFLHACLSETQRLHPSVPTDNKGCLEACRLPTGEFVGKGDSVLYSNYMMGRATDIWGEDADCFKPQRHLDDQGKLRTVDHFAFPAFNAGPRLCLGMEFAYLEMKVVAATLLLRFKLTPEKYSPKNPPPYRNAVVLPVQGPFTFYLQRREVA